MGILAQQRMPGFGGCAPTFEIGGCRCQAFQLTGDAANTDPVCDKSPHHHLIHDAAEEAAQQVTERPLIFRNPRNSREYA